MNIGKSVLNICQLSKSYPLSQIITRNYAFKSDLKIKWKRPEKVPCYKPQKSGDLEPMSQLNSKQYQLEFHNSKELENADELVKRLCSLEFAPRSKTTQVYIRNVIGKVHRHDLDKYSIEARIARWTGAIRAFQEVMEKYPRNKRMKVTLKELIDKRKKHLKYLRRWDYKRFEWLIESLGIVYKPPPSEFHWVTRRGSLVKLTQKYCDDLVDERLSAYRLKLEEEQPAFLEEKIRVLEFIQNEQKECGAEVTVKDEEIGAVKSQLAEVLKRKEVVNKDD